MSHEPSSILSLWKERIKILVQYSERSPVAGEDWYLVSSKWWREALQILEYNETHVTRDFFGPGVLDNSELLETSAAATTTTPTQTEFESERGTILLKSHLQYRQDYVLLPHEGWNALCSWFGANCGPPIVRKAIELKGSSNHRTIVEVYPLVLKVTCSTTSYPSKFCTFTFSKAHTLDYVKRTICSTLGLTPERVKMFNFLGGTKQEELLGDNITLDEAHIEDKQEILLEEIDEANNSSVNVKSQTSMQFFNSELSSSVGGQNSDLLLLLSDPNTTTVKNSGVCSLVKNSPTFGDSYEKKSSDVHSSSTIAAPTSTLTTTTTTTTSTNTTMTPTTTTTTATTTTTTTTDSLQSPPGLVGLYNFGNTCFMNAPLQCLINTLPLTQYFLEGHYHQDINRVNPIGSKGKVAEEFASLVQTVWDQNRRRPWIIPKALKRVIQEIAPQFTDCNQHDAHEMLVYLLDSLHEDLNCVIVKPSQTENQTTESLNNRAVVINEVDEAREAWHRHLARNNSIIVSLFHGQLKSRVTCSNSTCRYVSITFDPFMYLSVPLPKAQRQIVVTLVHPHMRGTKDYIIRLPASATVAHLLHSLAQCAGHLNPTTLLLTKLFQHRFAKVYQDNERVETINEDDQLVAYDVGQLDNEWLNIGEEESGLDDISGMNHPLKQLLSRETPPPPSQHIILPVLVRVLQLTPHSPSTTSSPTETSAVSSHTTSTFIVYPRPVLMPFLLHLSLDRRYSYTHLLCIAVARLSKLLRPFKVPLKRPLIELCSLSICDGQGNTIRELDASVDQFVDLTELVANSYCLALDCDLKLYTEKALEILRERDIVSETEFERSGVTLAECLQLFSAEERLTKENQWYCPKCKKWQEASKKLDIWWPPPILIIHLKRFAYTHWYRSKLDIFVDFPLEGLDLRGYVLGSPLTLSSTTTSTRSNESLLYDLYAVINHYGTLGGGHYTAIVKRVGVDNNMRWYHFDDTCISPITDPQHEIVTSAAYILFYKRRDLDFLSFLSSSSHSSSIISEDNSQSSLDCIDTNQLHSFHSSPQQQQQQQ